MQPDRFHPEREQRDDDLLDGPAGHGPVKCMTRPS